LLLLLRKTRREAALKGYPRYFEKRVKFSTLGANNSIIFKIYFFDAIATVKTLVVNSGLLNAV
jgi:hypothetical protein